jgi:hypothetical protein
MDTKESVLESLRGAFKIFLADLEALPEDVYNRSLGGKARTVADIVYEVNLVNDSIRLTMQGKTPPDWPEGGWVTAPEDARTKDVAIQSFKASSDQIIAMIEPMSLEDLEQTTQTEEGEKSRLDGCRFMTLHVYYHSGQLNFIQTLLGDDGWHWS